MKFILSATLLASMMTSTVFANDDRAAFKAVLEDLSHRTVESPLKCTITPLQGEVVKGDFRMGLKEESNYKDAFFVSFQEVKSGQGFTTLIAYEGKNNFVMGELSVSKKSTSTTFRHVFDGFLKDVVTVTFKGEKFTGLTYEKINPQKINFLTMKCK